MKSTIVIGAIVASIAVLANIGAIVDNACKYVITCSGNPEPLPAQPPKPEVVVVICDGRSTKLANGTIVCEANKQKSQPAPQSGKALPVPMR